MLIDFSYLLTRTEEKVRPLQSSFRRKKIFPMLQILHIENSVDRGDLCIPLLAYSVPYDNVDLVAIATVEVFQLLTSVEFGGKPRTPAGFTSLSLPP